MNQQSSRATTFGMIAILIWSTLAVLTAGSGKVPPFQLLFLTFSISAIFFATRLLQKKVDWQTFLELDRRVWLLGIGGLFGYHFFYFAALKSGAPKLEANLINYLWPLLIVLFSGFLPYEKLRAYHVLGALIGFIGVVVAIAGLSFLTTGGALLADPSYWPGYLSALAAAVTWGAYSVISRRFGLVPADAVGFFCLGSALLALPFHLAWESWVWPNGLQWLAILLMGIGPLGAAFWFWDVGMKLGDIRALGTMSYMAPILSNLLLIAYGYGQFTLDFGLGCLLVVVGGMIGSFGLWWNGWRRRRAS